ncbi:hypothetical protein M422DRAFT_27393 [Sphaerobolus stellatus SS14]|nr:hypothetical protein M422DRAFT_27393 [Sphaerobolus stellatus SS14]
MTGETNGSTTFSTTLNMNPDYDRLSEALKSLSEELPRLSNLDSHGVLNVLQSLREDVQRNIESVDNLRTNLEARLMKIEETLSSFQGPSMPVKSSPDPNGDENEGLLVSEESEDEHSSVKPALLQDENHVRRLDPRTGFLAKGGSYNREQGPFRGATAALVIFLVTMIPIIVILVWPDLL